MRYLSKADFEWPVALCLLLSCNSCFYFLIPRSILFALEVLSFGLLLWMSLIHGKNNINGRIIYIGMLLYIVGSLPLAIGAYNDILGFSLRFYFVLPCLLLYYSAIKYNSVFSMYYKMSDICYVLAILSLFFWLFGEIMNIIPPLNVVLIEWGRVSHVRNYYFLHFGCQGLRNCGVFPEAPMYNAVLTVCLGVELFLRQTLNKKKVVVFVLAILTTLSTTGQLALMGMLFVRFFVMRKKKLSSGMKLLVYGLFVVSIIAICVVGYSILLTKSEGLSFMVRLKYIMEELEAWKSAPLFGCGFYSYIDGSSNSFTLLLAEGGLYLSFLYILSLIVIPHIISKRLNIKGVFYFPLFFYLMICITVIPYCYITMSIIALYLSYCMKRQNMFILIR